ncbi:MAG: alpha/beta fold hydrolase [Parvibaculales bacterium]
MKTDNNGQQALVLQGELVDFQPAWFKAALAEKPQDKYINFNESKLHYRHWPCAKTDAESLVLIHGDGAHARWFDFIAPLLSPYYHVIAPDLPGMGDSGWLPAYSREIMADALMAMVRDAQFVRPPAIVAHSFGGLIGMIMAKNYAPEIAALMICDFHIRPKELHEEWFTTPRKLRVYETRAQAQARFRLAPDQPCANQFILDYIAEHSVRQIVAGQTDPLRDTPTQSGFTWKFDPAIYGDFIIGSDLREIYENLTRPMAMQFGALSYDFSNKTHTATRQEVIAYMKSLRPDVPHFDIVGAHHHIMNDQPHGFAAAILAVAEIWKSQDVFSTS